MNHCTSKLLGSTIIIYFLILNAAHFGNAKKPKNVLADVLAPPTPTPVLTDRKDILRRSLGDQVNTSQYNNMAYTGAGGGPVREGDDLECNFEGFCCWDNTPTNNNGFLNPLVWEIGRGEPERAKFVATFGFAAQPNGKYLISVQPATKPDVPATFSSCTVGCASSSVQVQFKHWSTPGVTLQVCTNEAFFNGNDQPQLSNCQNVNTNFAPGPSTVTLPKGRVFEIVIIARNFTSQTGNIVIIDDMQVSFTPCSGIDVKKETAKPIMRRHS